MTSTTYICRAVYEIRTYGFLSDDLREILTPDEYALVLQQTGASD